MPEVVGGRVYCRAYVPIRLPRCLPLRYFSAQRDASRSSSALSAILADLEGEYAGNLTQISAMYAQEGEFAVGGDVSLRRGMDQLPGYLSTGLNIALGCNVTAVTTAATQVCVGGWIHISRRVFVKVFAAATLQHQTC